MNISCNHEIYSLCGPLTINVYGFFIALGIAISTWCISRTRQYATLGLHHTFSNIICVSILAGIFGGRLLAIASEPYLYHGFIDWFALWNGGFSALGSILGVIIIVPLYLRYNNIPVFPVFDLVAIYAPLFQSIARLGCLFAGCCYGMPTTNFVHIVYTHIDTIAPYKIALHPTQLYSSVMLFIIFLYMFFVVQQHIHRTGYAFTSYLMLVTTERFVVDFWRADRILFNNSFLSLHQWIALLLCLAIMVYQTCIVSRSHKINS